MELTYKNIAIAAVDGFSEMNDDRQNEILHGIGQYLNGEGGRALQFPDAEPESVSSWDEIEYSEIQDYLEL